MNIKNITLVLFIILVSGCTVQFDRNVRVESSGKVIDENNAPIPNIFIGVYTEAGRFSLTSNSDREYLLGSGTSNNQGDFSVTSLFDSDQDFFIFIDGEGTYTDYIYSANTFQFEPENFRFNLNEVQLKTRAEAAFNITRTSPPGTTLELVINYQSPFCEAVFIDGVLDEDSSNCNRTESIFRTLDNDNPELTTTFNSFITGTIQFVYSINGGNHITENFVINQENYGIDFSY